MNEETNLPEGLQLAVKLLAQIGNDDSDRAIAAVHDLAEAHAQRLTLQHHAADQVWRISDLKVKCVTLKGLHDAVADERDALRVKVSDLERAAVKRREISDGVEAELVDECVGDGLLKRRPTAVLANGLRAKYDELLVALHGIGAALGIQEGDRSPYSVTCGVLERVNRLAEIEAQEPVALVGTSGNQGAGIGWSGAAQPVGAKLYARPVPAQAVPDADGARFRWLCEDHSDRETRERCRSLIDRLPVMSYSDAVMSIDAAMAAAPEHKA